MRKKGLLTQQGNRLKYVDSTGKENLEYRKDWDGTKLEIIMNDFDKLSTEPETVEEETINPEE